MIQSPYDEWVLDNLLVVSCLSNRQEPYSIEKCNDTCQAAIEAYRQ